LTIDALDITALSLILPFRIHEVVMKRFSTSNYCNYRETLLILLLLTIGIVGNDNGVNAQNIFAGNNIANSTNEQILYSNPQYFTLPKEQPFQNDDAPPPEAALTVVGLLFNLRSKLPEGREDSNANTIYITGFEFFTSMAGTVFYQLSSREGEYYDQQEGKDGGPGIGNWTSFDLISGGTAEGTGGCRLQGASAGGSSLFKPQIMNQAIERADNNTTTEVCPLTIIPKEDFITPTDTYPWTLRANSTRSFYITLASKHLLVMPGNSASSNSSFDTVVAASTPDLELYEGVAARTYPLHQDESDYYHDEPMGFIGKIYYHGSSSGSGKGSSGGGDGCYGDGDGYGSNSSSSSSKSGKGDAGYGSGSSGKSGKSSDAGSGSSDKSGKSNGEGSSSSSGKSGKSSGSGYGSDGGYESDNEYHLFPGKASKSSDEGSASSSKSDKSSSAGYGSSSSGKSGKSSGAGYGSDGGYESDSGYGSGKSGKSGSRTRNLRASSAQ